MKQVNQVGVDVDSEELVCAMQRAGQLMPLATFANTAAGHKKFIRWAIKGARLARVCLEATGIYSLQFALTLHHAKNVEVMVVNPRVIKDFARARMQRAKTDAVDAGGILEYLERMPFAAWQPPATAILELQAINRRIVQLNTELTREKNRRHASQFAGAPVPRRSPTTSRSISITWNGASNGCTNAACTWSVACPHWPPSLPIWSRPKASPRPRRCACWPNCWCSRTISPLRNG